jgi:hypothetical protein
MKHKFILIMALALTISACSPEQGGQFTKSGSGFDVLCSEFSTLTQTANYLTLSSEERGTELDGVLTQKLRPDNNAYLAWSAIRNATPTERYSLYKEAATSTGYNDWECAAIAQHGQEVGSSFE